MSVVWVTGASGFVAAHVGEQPRSAGQRVRTTVCFEARELAGLVPSLGTIRNTAGARARALVLGVLWVGCGGPSAGTVDDATAVAQDATGDVPSPDTPEPTGADVEGAAPEALDAWEPRAPDGLGDASPGGASGGGDGLAPPLPDGAGAGWVSFVREVPACASAGVGAEACDYSVSVWPGACAGGACDRLVVHFSGGQESCPDPAKDTSFLAHYVTHGYVLVCARDFLTSAGSGDFPRHREGARLDVLMGAIRADPDVTQWWTGRDLLISGVSHGASGPALRLAAAPSGDWQGSRTTGACFYDGTYDPAGLLALEYAEHCTPLTSVLSYPRSYQRYCEWPDGAKPNLPATWPLPESCSGDDLEADTLVAGSALTVRDWKLIECGSALGTCAGDVLPAPPIEALCGAIASTPDHRCEYGSYPTTSHVTCGVTGDSKDACRGWFDALVAEP